MRKNFPISQALKSDSISSPQTTLSAVPYFFVLDMETHLSVARSNSRNERESNVQGMMLLESENNNLISNSYALGGSIFAGSSENKQISNISWLDKFWTATAGSDVVQSGRPIFDDFFQHLWPYIGNNTANVVFQMVKRLWLIRVDQ
ncbi:hypothetical protein TNCV_3270181 [Trichonephila clavipes]|uniref:Uncharacterized protein n=1 Tax=Trichonephila clavipes TaxID=2585209 RepID=A0A8X6S3K4_TRICX|nr:hypothetical protein TNCV_3270181 [Trichonephila clavipes]